MPPPTAPRIRNAPRISSSSVSKIHKFVDTESRTPNNVSKDNYMDGGEIRDLSNPSPFGSNMMKDLNTPSTAATEQSSFWSAQLGLSPVPLSPFPSPAGAPLSDNFVYSMGTYRIPLLLVFMLSLHRSHISVFSFSQIGSAHSRIVHRGRLGLHRLQRGGALPTLTCSKQTC
jgi:hypothetical protein